MSFGQVAFGIASIVIGVNHLSKGAKALSGAAVGRRVTQFPRDFGGFGGPMAAPAPLAMPGQPFMNSGRRMVQTSAGQRVPMQMRSFNIRTLDDRIRYLSALVNQGKRDPHVYAFARRALTRKCNGKWCVPEKNNLAEAHAIFDAVQRQQRADLATSRNLFRNIRRNTRYTSDIAGVDTYQKPAHTLALHTADCDDYTTLTCSALQSVGIPCRAKVIRTKGAGDWNHIYPQAGFPRQNPKRWVSMDSSVNMPFGWEAPPSMVAASRVFRVG